MANIPTLITTSGIRPVGHGWIPHVALVQDREWVGEFNAIAGWTVLGNDTLNHGVQDGHILGTHALVFDKVDGAANTIFAGLQCTLTSMDLSRFVAHDEFETAIFVSSVATITYAFIRLGTDVSNYNEWRIPDTELTAGVWAILTKNLAACQTTVVGTGWNSAAVTYLSIGVAFDAETDALADMAFDHLFLGTAQRTI